MTIPRKWLKRSVLWSKERVESSNTTFQTCFDHYILKEKLSRGRETRVTSRLIATEILTKRSGRAERGGKRRNQGERKRQTSA